MSESLIIEFGNTAAHHFVEDEKLALDGLRQTRFSITPQLNEDGTINHPNYTVGTSAVDILRHFAQNPGPVKHMGGNELVQDVIGLWERHSDAAPAWVSVVDPGPYPPDDMEDLERFIAEYWGCERGVPDDVEDTHYTQYGDQLFAPGEAPSA